MKKLSILGLFIFALISFNSCETEDDVVFTTDNNGELVFTNNFSAEYILTPQTASNLGERFTWTSAELDVPTNVTYQLEKSILGDFSDAEIVGATTGNEIAITIGDMSVFATEAGLDNDPETVDVPDTGDVYFRLKSIVGDGSLENFSTSQALTLVMQEVTDTSVPVCEFDQLYLVGSAIPSAGWDWGTPAILPCTANGVYSGNVGLIPDDASTGDVEAFRFFTTATDWGSGRNYPFYEDDGYTITGFGNAMDGDSNFEFTGGTAGNYFLTVDTVNKTITVGPPQATGTCEFDQLYLVGSAIPSAGWDWGTPVILPCISDGVYSGDVGFIPDDASTSDVEAFRFFTAATDWGSGRNYPFYEDDGYTITGFGNAMDGDSNFEFTGAAGIYTLTVDTVAKTISVE